MPPNPNEENQLQLELRQLQTVRASFEALKRYADIIAASVEGTLDNFATVTGYAERLEAVVKAAEKDGADESRKGKAENEPQ
ncbi:MAG: hypothetical protein M1839_002612 [Geoglossum umbratile]|nr:MAG: hypothetical protein M1839_002612 [Geoglossum umbratile]